MKLLLIALLAFSFSAIAADMMPNFYGKVSKEIRYVDQKPKFMYHTFNGAQDVENSLTRLGAKNTYKVNGLDASYAIELGIRTMGSTELYVRKSKLDLAGAWGTVTLGRDYTAVSDLWLEIDPFGHTGNAVTGIDQAADVANVSTNIGYYYRSRKDEIKYATPVFAGLQLKTSIDQNGGTSRAKAATDKKYWDTALIYKGDMGNVKPMFAFGYSKVMGEYTSGTNVYTNDVAMYFLGKVEFGATYVGLHYGTLEKEYKSTYGHATTAKKPEDKFMTVSLQHKLGMGKAALAYSKHNMDTKSAGTNADKSADSQIALGYTHEFSSNVEMHIVLAQVEHKEDNATNQTANGNKATMVNIGTTINF